MSISSAISTSYYSYTTFDHNTESERDATGNTDPSSIKESSSPPSSGQRGVANELTEEEKRVVEKLAARDREVRAHESAHVAAGGRYVRGGANFEYQTGPDRKRYAVGGEVSIDTSEVSGNPQATIRKMQVVRKAALAPARPSGQDRSVAAQASSKEMQARAELKEEAAREQEEKRSENESPDKQTTPKTFIYSNRGNPISTAEITRTPFCNICV